MALTGRGEERVTRLSEMYEHLRQYDPLTLSRPSVQLSLASWWRRAGRTDLAAQFLQSVPLGTNNTHHRSAALGELWLASQEGGCPTSTCTCRFTEEKPYLDGVLDDLVWKGTHKVRLSNSIEPELQDQPVVQVMRDSEFLYIAAECFGGEFQAQDREDLSSRQRDRIDSDGDHVEISLDVDRDWQTAFEFTVSRHGDAIDAVCGSEAWNPDWFYLSKVTETGWTVEAAIPLRELTSKPPEPREAWGIGIRRICPERPVESWPESIDQESDIARQGFLIFD
jgi:hypothetical protein